jgi:hypothetical protein
MESPWPERRLGPRGVVTADEARALVTMARSRAQAYAASDLGCDLDDRACRTTEIHRVARRLVRRPLTLAEEADLTTLYDANEGPSAESRFAAVVEALIESPYFVFRVELGNGNGPVSDRVQLTAHEVATRLAHFLWRSGPDDALLDAADANRLATTEGIEVEALRMLGDPRATHGLTELTREWLELVGFDAMAGEVGLSEELRADMREQTELFLHRIFQSEPTLDELLLATTHPINAALRAHYDAGAPRIVGFADDPLDPQRFSGILTHGTLLVSTPSVSRRGAFVRRRLLCDEISPPPSEPVPPAESATRREWFEQNVDSEGVCAGCHRLLDPVGFGLGGFDQWGRAQEQALDGYVIDLIGGSEQPFVGPRGLAELLVSSPQVSACTTRHWLEYALDRGPDEPVLMIPPSGGGDSDAPIGPGGEPRAPTAIECLSNAFFNSAGSFVALAVGIAKSAPFRSVTAPTPGSFSPGGASGATPIERAIAETSNLLSVYETEGALVELDAYLAALRAIADDDLGAGGAGGAGP